MIVRVSDVSMGKEPYPDKMPDEGWPDDDEPLPIRDDLPDGVGGKVPYPDDVGGKIPYPDDS
jgi:hypothetical protein